MKSFYLSCFMLVLLLSACTSSPLVNFDENDYENGLNKEYNARRNKRDWKTCNFPGEKCNTIVSGRPINGCCPGAKCGWTGVCIVSPGKK